MTLTEKVKEIVWVLEKEKLSNQTKKRMDVARMNDWSFVTKTEVTRKSDRRCI